jgi:hypothetical protein
MPWGVVGPEFGGGVRGFDKFGGAGSVKKSVGMVAEAAERVNSEGEQENASLKEGWEVDIIGYLLGRGELVTQ